MEFIKKNGLGLLAIIILISFAVYNNNLSNTEEKSLIKNKLTTIGTITGVDFFPRGLGLYINYEFNANDSLIKNRKQINIEKSNINKVNSILLGKLMPIVYDSTAYNNNQIIKSLQDCIDYNVQVDDDTKIILIRLDSMLVTNK